MLKVPESWIRYTPEPEQPEEYTRKMNRYYFRFAGWYDAAVKILPLWKKWISRVEDDIRGERVLEVSCGTGYLMGRCAGEHRMFGLDYNRRMIDITSQNLQHRGLTAGLVQADVAAIPFLDQVFDTVVITMAFTGYPDGRAALQQISRVLAPEGQLLLVDIEYPENRNLPGYLLTRLMEGAGDTIRDLTALLEGDGYIVRESEIGGFGSVHYYRASKG